MAEAQDDVETMYSIGQVLEDDACTRWIKLEANLLMCGALRGRGTPGAAIRPAREALELAQRLRSWEAQLHALYQLGLTLVLVDEEEEGVGILYQAMEAVESF